MGETGQRETKDVLWGRQGSGGPETCYGGDWVAGTGDVLWGRQGSWGLETCYGGDRAVGDETC